MTKSQKISAGRLEQLDELVASMGIPWDNLALLDDATTHKSFASENNSGQYERLEFFGDAVLKFVVAEYLFEQFPEMHEGQLTEIAAVLISAKMLEQVGRQLDVQRCIRVGRAVPMQSSMIARATEAILGALYLDSGFLHVRPFIVARICASALAVAGDSVKDNFKAQLQQFSQARAQGTPLYTVEKVDGPPHDPVFYVSVRVGQEMVAEGSGRSKKIAEQAAAKAACAKLSPAD